MRRDLLDFCLQDERFQPQEKYWLLQARPITNLAPAPLQDVRWEPPIPGTLWMRRQVVEHMPEPLSPLFADLYLREGLMRSIEVLMTFMSDLTDPADISKLLEKATPGSFAITVNGYAYSVANFNFRWNLVAQCYGSTRPWCRKWSRICSPTGAIRRCPPISTPLKKTLLTLAAAMVALVFWWKNRQQSSIE